MVAFQGWVREASPGQFHGGELMFGELGAVGSAGRCSASLAALPLRHSWYPLPTPSHIAGLIPGVLIPLDVRWHLAVNLPFRGCGPYKDVLVGQGGPRGKPQEP